MKRCPSCGQETRDDSQEFCTRCGAYFVTGHQGPAKIGQTGMDMPEDPVERGMALMDVGSFGEAVRIWDGVVRSGTVVDDITYRRMVDSAAGCMLGTVMQPQMYASAAIPQFASAMPDREFVSDLMAKLAGSLGVCSIQNGVLGLANSYMMLFLDCFAVYTDLRDLLRSCEGACEDLGAMVAKASVLPDAIQAKGPGPLEWLSAYQDFAALLRGTVSDMMDGSSEEAVSALADRWAVARSITSLGPVQAAFTFNTQAVVAGSITSRMLLKSRDSQVKAFSKRYMKGPE